MTQTKFIELLNLYVDHQITLGEASQLEAEIQQNPERREIYRQYCRIHQGCSQLAGSFAPQVASGRTKVDLSRSPSRQHHPAWYAGMGALTAAACVAFILVSPSNSPVEPPTLLEGPVVATAVVAESEPRFSQVALPLPGLSREREVLQTVFIPRTVDDLSIDHSTRPLFARDGRDPFDWMNQVQLVPVETGDFSFQVRPAAIEPSRTFRSRRPFEGKVEMTAFQFQR